MSDRLLEVSDLHTVFTPKGALGRSRGGPVRAVDGVSLHVDRGDLVALVGESGCGKTTTAQSIVRMVEATSGSIRLDGDDITHTPQRALTSVRRRIQLVFQDPYEALNPRFRVRQTVLEPLLIHRLGTDAADRQARVVEALTTVGLTPVETYLDRYPHELSGGQRQRVAIAAGLVLEPDLLVADEPVSMLDVSVRAGILDLLDGLRRSRGLGILMITHDLATAARFADRVAVMYLGRIVEEGPAAHVIAHPQHPYTRALVSVVPQRDPRRRLAPVLLTGEPPNAAAIPSGCRFHPRCPLAVDSCRVDDPLLLPAADSVAGHAVACPVTATRRS